MRRFEPWLPFDGRTPAEEREQEAFELRFADVTISMRGREAWRGGEVLHLSLLEYELLAYLVRHPHEGLTRRRLSEEVWGRSAVERSNYVDVAIMGLRRKLEEGGQPRLIQSLRGYGYILREEQRG